MLFRILLWGFILVMVFRFVARFVFPILKITRVTQDRLRQMQQQMEEMQRGQGHMPPHASATKKKVKEEDYIEFEEVK